MTDAVSNKRAFRTLVIRADKYRWMWCAGIALWGAVALINPPMRDGTGLQR